MPNAKLGSVYEIQYYDHFDSARRSSRDCTEEIPLILKAYGYCVAINKYYIVLAWSLDTPTSENNDNIHIFKKAIKSIRELK